MSTIEVTVSPMEIGEAIAKGALRKYADPQGLKVDEKGVKADRYGILIQFSPQHRLLRFRFTLRDFPGKLVDVRYPIDDFVAGPEKFLTNTHRAMRERLDELHKAERSPLVLLSPGGLQKAMNDARDEVQH